MPESIHPSPQPSFHSTSQPSPTDLGGERARLVALPGGQHGRTSRARLPSAVSSFVGREKELGEVIRLLRDHRLVTLTGPGGMGKTRLAYAVAGELQEIFADAVWVVELAPLGAPDQVGRAMAKAVDVGERPGHPLAETLTEVLAGRTGLLVLDNCEHLVDAAAGLVATLLRGCPHLSVLATSREPLGITGEVAWPVPPLEHDNLRRALTWLVEREHDGPEPARLAAALWPFWFARGFPTEGIAWLQAGARRAGARGRAAKARALNGLVVLAVFQEDYALAWASGQEALALYRELDDPDGIATCLTALGTTAVAGQLPGVEVPSLVTEARSLEPRLRERRVIGYLRDIEGVLALNSGDPDGAIRMWQEALALQREIGNQLGEAFTLSNLGLLAVRLGDVERATAWLVEDLRLSQRLDYKLLIHYCFIGLGRLAADASQLSRAARLWGAADTMTEAYGAHLTRATRAVVDYDHRLAAAQTRIDPETWTCAWAEGRRLTTDQAVAYALDTNEHDPVPTAHSRPGGLTDREVDVLRLVAQGLTSADAGRRLFLSPRTVDWHLSSIYSKLGVRSRTEAARFALDHGLS